MNRDAILATIIGFMLGLLITSFVLFGPKVLKSISSIKIDTSKISFLQNKNITPTPAEKIIENNPISNEPLIVSAPLNDAIVESDEILVSGTALPSSYVIIGGPIDEMGIFVQSDGKFAGKTSLNEGKNTILVSAYNNQNVVQKTIDVYYSIDKLD